MARTCMFPTCRSASCWGSCYGIALVAGAAGCRADHVRRHAFLLPMPRLGWAGTRASSRRTPARASAGSTSRIASRASSSRRRAGRSLPRFRRCAASLEGRRRGTPVASSSNWPSCRRRRSPSSATSTAARPMSAGPLVPSARPVVEALGTGLRANRARLSSKIKTATAIDYMLKRWPAFTRFLDDGRIAS